jgi:hypothetical protein
MIRFRYLLMLAPLLALAACDKEPAPPIEPVEPPQPQVSAPVAPATSEPAPAAKPPAKQVSELAKPNPVAKPIADTPRAEDKSEASEARAPIVPLDLSLPDELLEPTQAVDTFGELPPTLLPPLFDQPGGPGGPFQLHGKLITNERGDQDYWESLDGAELQFEFKR